MGDSTQILQCRICLEDESDGEFCNPCLCDGTSKWVHKKCLQKWRNINRHREGYKKCMECGYNYHLEKKYEDETFLVYFLSDRVFTYILTIGIISFFTGIFLKFWDEYNHTLSLKILSWGDSNLNQRLNHSLTYTSKSLYYQSLSIQIYTNIFFIIFFILALYNTKRKQLYLQLISKRYILQFLQINNMLFSFLIFLYFDLIDSFIPFNTVISFYTIFLTQQIIEINNQKIHNMNTYHNPDTVLNYESRNPDETINLI